MTIDAYQQLREECVKRSAAEDAAERALYEAIGNTMPMSDPDQFQPEAAELVRKVNERIQPAQINYRIYVLKTAISNALTEACKLLSYPKSVTSLEAASAAINVDEIAQRWMGKSKRTLSGEDIQTARRTLSQGSATEEQIKEGIEGWRADVESQYQGEEVLKTACAYVCACIAFLIADMADRMYESIEPQ